MSDHARAATNGADDVTAVILAAGGVAPTIPISQYVSTPAMMPVAGRPLLHWQLQRLLELGIRDAVVATASPAPGLAECARSAFGSLMTVRAAAVGATPDVLTTLRCALAEVEARRVLVLLGDTLFSFDGTLFGHGALTLCARVDDPDPWCTGVVAGDRIDAIVEQRSLREPGPAGDVAFVGVYAFDDRELLTTRVAAVLDGDGEHRGELSQLLRPYVDEGALHWAEAADWLDYGHPTEAAVSTARLRSRAFNEISIDPQRGLLTKRSVDVAKLWDEHHYVESLPGELRQYFPRVVEAAFGADDARLVLEYYGYPTLAELFLYADLDAAKWGRLYGAVGRILDDFATQRRPLSRSLLVEMYVDKIVQRLESSRVPARLRATMRRPVLWIDGVEVENPLADPARLAGEVRAHAGQRPAAVIHGDLTFSNILVEPLGETCRLIDPRGSFGLPGVFGDPWYDLAKLAHAALGLYDLLAQDMFDVAGDGDAFTLTLYATSRQRELGAVFADWLDARCPAPGHVVFLAGLIMLALPSHHFESPDRQLALFLRGCQLTSLAWTGDEGRTAWLLPASASTSTA